MQNTYVTIESKEIDFTPLQEKIYTIKSYRFIDARIIGDIQYFRAFVNDYLVIVRFGPDIIQGSCACRDFEMRKRLQNKFCKHILFIIDHVLSESSS